MSTKHKFVRVFNTLLEKSIEIEKWEVSDHNITYDANGVLTVREILNSSVVKVIYGPRTWKYIEFIEEVVDEEKEKD